MFSFARPLVLGLGFCHIACTWQSWGKFWEDPENKTRNPVAVLAKSVSGSADSVFWGASSDAAGNVYVAGTQNLNGVFDYGNSVIATGNYASGTNSVLVKYNSQADTLWAKSTVTASNPTEFKAVTIDFAGNVITAGAQQGTAAVDYGGASATGNYSVRNAALVKYNNSGTVQWAKSVTTGPSASTYQAVTTDGSGNIFAAGFQFGSSAFTYTGSISTSAGGAGSGNNSVIVKYDTAGTGQWARSATGGSGTSVFAGVVADTAGNVYAVGYQTGTGGYTYSGLSPAGTATTNNPVIVKFNASGTAIWAKTLVGGGTDAQFRGVTIDTSGNPIVTGYQAGTVPYTYASGFTLTGTNPGSFNSIVIKYDSAGNVAWARVMTGGSGDAYLNTPGIDTGGNTIACGYQAGAGPYTFDAQVSATGAYTAGKNAAWIRYNSSGVANAAASTLVAAADSEFKAAAADLSGGLWLAGLQTGNTAFYYGESIGALGSYAGGTNAVLVKYK